MSFEALGLKDFAETALTTRPEFDEDLFKKIIPFGVSYLDKMMYGIMPDDLCLIGAPSGVGKSELASQIAFNAAKKKKRVTYFALEYTPGEVEIRTKYRLYMHCLELDKGKSALGRANYLDYRLGLLRDLLRPYEETVNEAIKELVNMKVFYRVKDFGLKDFVRIFNAMDDKQDLVVVDHLSYFDLDDDNENKATTEIMKKVRDLNQLTNVPVVMVGHLRKADRREKPLVAGLEDFMGTSNVPKIATKIITLAPGAMVSDCRFQTYFRIAKCRVDGKPTKYVGLGTFNTQTNEYEKEFVLGQLRQNEKEFEPIPDNQHPIWYRERR